MDQLQSFLVKMDTFTHKMDQFQTFFSLFCHDLSRLDTISRRALLT